MPKDWVYWKGIDRKAYKEQQYDILADEVRKNIDMDFVYKIIEEGVNGTYSYLLR